MPSSFEITAGKLMGPTTGGSVTQATNKGTAVTLNTASGVITMNDAALAAGAEVDFVVNNDKCTATSCVIVNHASGGTAGSYIIDAVRVQDGSFKIMVSNVSDGSLGQAIVINFALVKISSS